MFVFTYFLGLFYFISLGVLHACVYVCITNFLGQLRRWSMTWLIKYVDNDDDYMGTMVLEKKLGICYVIMLIEKESMWESRFNHDLFGKIWALKRLKNAYQSILFMCVRIFHDVDSLELASDLLESTLMYTIV